MSQEKVGKLQCENKKTFEFAAFIIDLKQFQRDAQRENTNYLRERTISAYS